MKEAQCVCAELPVFKKNSQVSLHGSNLKHPNVSVTTKNNNPSVEYIKTAEFTMRNFKVKLINSH